MSALDRAAARHALALHDRYLDRSIEPRIVSQLATELAEHLRAALARIDELASDYEVAQTALRNVQRRADAAEAERDRLRAFANDALKGFHSYLGNSREDLARFAVQHGLLEGHTINGLRATALLTAAALRPAQEGRDGTT